MTYRFECPLCRSENLRVHYAALFERKGKWFELEIWFDCGNCGEGTFGDNDGKIISQAMYSKDEKKIKKLSLGQEKLYLRFRGEVK